MTIKNIKVDKSNANVPLPLFKVEVNGQVIDSGTIFLKKGIRIPETDFNRYEREISYLLEGEIEIIGTDGKIKGKIGAGEAIMFDQLEPQAGNVIRDTTIIYFLIY